MGCKNCKGENENETEIFTIDDEKLNKKMKRKDILLKSKSPNKLNSTLKKLLKKNFMKLTQIYHLKKYQWINLKKY